MATSISKLECVTGAWDFRYVSGAQLVVRDDAPLSPSSTPPPPLSVWQGYFALSPANASAAGGAPLAIIGFGFDALITPACDSLSPI